MYTFIFPFFSFRIYLFVNQCKSQVDSMSHFSKLMFFYIAVLNLWKGHHHLQYANSFNLNFFVCYLLKLQIPHFLLVIVSNLQFFSVMFWSDLLYCKCSFTCIDIIFSCGHFNIKHVKDCFIISIHEILPIVSSNRYKKGFQQICIWMWLNAELIISF